MRTTIFAFATAFTLGAGCVDEALPDEPTTPNLLDGDDKADGQPLWAGLTSLALVRYSSDLCDDGAHALPDAFVYDEFARQRAGVRNVCFEVWSPGITDWDNPSFWQQLDVRVYYRWGREGDWASDYVPSIDRRGNNRRYAWNLDQRLDPIVGKSSVVAAGAPLRILSESESHARIEKDLEFYFTINGRRLDSAQDAPFVVHYQGELGTPHLAPAEDGHILTDHVVCADGAMRIGSGPGYLAVDIRDPEAIAALGGGLDGSEIYGIPVGRATNVMSMSFSGWSTVWGTTLPQLDDRGGGSVVPDLDSDAMTVFLETYVRAQDLNIKRSYRFTGCASVP